MSDRRLKDKLKHLAKEKNIDFNTLFRLYAYDRFIERLSISKYKNHFILKGGFYLSLLYGVENRATMDIDTLFKNAEFKKEKIKEMIEEIILVDIHDDAKLELESIKEIKEEDEYGGFRVNLKVKYENSINRFHLDIATGDIITPKEIDYKYKPILKDNFITLKAYNIETIVAEKLEAILSRVELNSRMRDFYDIYLICSSHIKLKKATLKKAFLVTLKKREYKGNILDTFKVIQNSKILEKRWIQYQKKYEYAKDISYSDITDMLEKLILMFNF